MIRVAFVLLASVLFLNFNASASEPISMKDLAALAEQGQWIELISKATDVPPSIRTNEWKSLVTQAAKESLGSPGFDNDPRKTLAYASVLLDKYPHLANETEVMELRAQRSWKAFEECFQARTWASECNQILKKFISADPKNKDLALKAADIVSKSFSSKHVAIPYFHAALKNSASADTCKQGSLQQAAIGALGLNGPAEEIHMAQEIVFGKCWSSLGQDFVKEITNTDAHLKNTCAELLKKKVLSGPRLAKCQRLASSKQ